MSPAPRGGPNLIDVKIKVDGTPLSAAWQHDLVDVRVQRGLCSIGRAVLRFRDEGLAKIGNQGGLFAFGTTVEIVSSNHATNRDVTLLTGEVVAREADVDTGGQHFAVTIHDAAAKLAASSMTVTTLNATQRDVLAKIASAHGMRLNAPTDEVREWSLHARTPLAIVQEIAALAGWHWTVTGDNLALWPASTANAPESTEVSAELGAELLNFQVRDSVAAVRDVAVHSWDHRKAQEVKAEAKAAEQRATSPFVSSARVKKPGKYVLGHALVADQEEAARVAAAAAGTGGRVVARGRAIVLGALVPGGTLTVTNAGDLRGKYYVREVEHHFGRGGAWTEFIAGDRDAPNLTDPWSQPTPSRVQTRFDRLTVAVVTEVGNGKEGKPAGAVRVKFVALDGSVASHWATVVQQGAGKGRGFTMLPDVNDQVVIGFADGDLRRPLVIGSVYSDRDLPDLPEELVDSSGAVVIQSLVTRNGDRFEMRADPQGKKHHVRISLKGEKHRLRLGEDASEFVVPDGVPIEVSAGAAKIVLDGKGKITLEGNDIILKAKNSVDISGTTVKIAASSSAELSANGAAKVKSSATNIESSGPTVVKGAVVNIN
ncbi:Uncharacterized conserved protein, implicated in type VI secretion and phage assembly [Micrococcales bacterium KH10]|nr:Uncharacterized conserved protein, implicated in type VI secretion and phage assembly [Micrococcales bacterium KH10]